uniref:Class I SAM-dependent methyltransferase n=1 Tax=Roseihalotalea indica TaxID=2867963 RepID=A0AA49JIZ9_9BACT|nr:class I SAM-dependent methyltransferase [Tunicatimonas sp. TK19036]
MSVTEIKPIAMPGTHQNFLKFFKRQQEPAGAKVLDVGAGHGAFSKQLHEMGYQVSACDLFPEIFHYDQIECKKVDITQPFPYEDNSFDMIMAIEVMEHINDHENFFKEASRILKPNGRLYISTPNILSLKSRIRFLFSGFYYSFQPLNLKNYDGLQHVASLTVDQYNYIAIRQGFNAAEVEIDKKQSTSRWLLAFFSPFLWLYPKLKKIGQIHNTQKLLLGRLLLLTFRNNPDA